MNADLLKKYKDTEEKIKLITLVIQKTIALVDQKLHAQLNFIQKTTTQEKISSLQESITHYTHLHGSLDLMILSSASAMFARKLFKAIKKGDKLTKIFDKWQNAVVDFWNNASSTIEPIEYFSNIYDPKNNKETKSESSVGSLKDIAKILSGKLDELKKIADSLAKDKKVLERGTKSAKGALEVEYILDNIKETIGAYDIPYNLGEKAEVGGDSTQDTPQHHRTNISIEANLTKLAFIKQALKTGNFGDSAQKYYENVVLTSLEDILGKNWDNLPEDHILLYAVTQSGILDVFDENLIQPIKDYILAHSAKYKMYIDLAGNTETLVTGGGSDSILQILNQMNEYKNLISEIHQIDVKILEGIAIDEFRQVDSISSIPDIDSQIKRFNEIMQNTNAPMTRPSTINQINNKLGKIISTLSKVNNLVDQTHKISFNKNPPGPDEYITKITDAVTRIDNYMEFIKKYSHVMREIEELCEIASIDIQSANSLITQLIGPDVTTCILRPGSRMRAIIHKTVMENILKSRFEGYDQEKINEIYIQLNVNIPNDPNINIYNNGITMKTLQHLSEKLLTV